MYSSNIIVRQSNRDCWLQTSVTDMNLRINVINGQTHTNYYIETRVDINRCGQDVWYEILQL